MTQPDDFAQKLKEYDEAFDFYMDHGKLPENMSHGDLLGGLIGQTIQDNPQLESQEPLWTELLKEELMKFIEAMLQLFQPVEEYHRKEQALIDVFIGGGLAQKRNMWGQIIKVIKDNYKPEELHLDGYKAQLNESESERQKEIILNALGHEWKKASDDKMEKRKQHLLTANQQRREQHLREYGLSDYQDEITLRAKGVLPQRLRELERKHNLFGNQVSVRKLRGNIMGCCNVNNDIALIPELIVMPQVMIDSHECPLKMFTLKN